MRPDLQESHMLGAFLKLQVELLHFLFSNSQRNGPPKFQLQTPRTFKATALQSGDNRKIYLYSNLQMLNRCIL